MVHFPSENPHRDAEKPVVGFEASLLVDAGDGFRTVAQMQVRSLALNRRAFDAASVGAVAEWRDLERMTLAGSASFRDAASDAIIRERFFDQHAAEWRIDISGLGSVEGPFLVAALEYAGEHDGEALFAMSLASAGPLTTIADPTDLAQEPEAA
jgi:TP901-1 family phage major tail protein